MLAAVAAVAATAVVAVTRVLVYVSNGNASCSRSVRVFRDRCY